MIDQAYIDNVHNFMGPKSIDYIKEVELNLTYATEKWQLTDISMMELSYNYVVGAKSKLYGSVVIKICLPGKEFLTEYHALKELNDMVELIDADTDKRILVLRRLNPGRTLWSLIDMNEKLLVAAPLINNTPSQSFGDFYPTHESWIDNIFLYVEKHYGDHRLLKHLKSVKTIYDELDVAGNEKMLLHGDLHHGNILSGDTWQVIDPKGAIGYKSLEVGRYMNNQIFYTDDFDTCLELMVDAFSTELNFDKEIILLSFYIDMVLSTSWFLNSHVVDEDEVMKRTNMCDKIQKKL